MRSRRKNERGFTLVELMLTLGVSGIVMTGIAAAFVLQHRTHVAELNYIEAQQNARASIALLKRYIRDSGWGFMPNAAAGGVNAPIGQCFACDVTDPTTTPLAIATTCTGILTPQDNCDNFDPDVLGASGGPTTGTDRLRVVRMRADEFVPRNPEAFLVAGPIPAVDTTLGGVAGHPLASPDYIVVSGECDGDAPREFGHSIIEVIGDGGASGGGSDHTYNIGADVSWGCTTGYDASFNIGRAFMADFFIHQSDREPRLMVRLGLDEATDNFFVVAYDIEDLQAVYGVDTGDPEDATPTNPDGRVALETGAVDDDWCDDLTDANCADGFGSLEDRRARVQAVRVSIVARTADPNPRRTGTDTLIVENHNYTVSDRRTRWIYRSTIALRNNKQR